MTSTERTIERNVATKRFVVTGAARGIGFEIARTALLADARVCLVDMDPEGLEQARVSLADKVLDAEAVVADLSDADAATRAVDEGAARLGGLDVLVNNAGGSAFTPPELHNITEEHFDRVIGWNIKSTFFCTQAATKHLREAGRGSIVNISAISGRAGTELLPPHYSAAKAAVIGFTRNLARHLGPEGIRVNVVAPGFIRSGPRVEAIWSSRDPAEVLGQIPLRRRGEPSEVAEAVLFLASDASSYITGTVLDVNGGFFCV